MFHFKSHSEHFVKSEFPDSFPLQKVRFHRKSQMPSNKPKTTQLTVWATFNGIAGLCSISKAILNILSNPSSPIHFHDKRSDFIEKVKCPQISQKRPNSRFGQLLTESPGYVPFQKPF